MKTLSLFLFVFASSLFATELDTLIQKALQNSPSLEVIDARLKANKQSIDVANQFANPELLITTNTLDSSQKMSQTVVTLKQKIPYFSKRDTKQKVSLAQEELLNEQLTSAKVQLVAAIKESAYTVWEIQALLRIIDEYIELTQKNIELYESYTSVSDTNHMGIMKAELSLSKLKIQKSTLQSQLQKSYARLSYLAAYKVDTLSLDLQMGKKPNLQTLQGSLKNNPQLAIREKEIQKQHAKIELADIDNYPDINLLAGYAYRENFDDYFNLGFAISLPMYGTEDAQEQKQKVLLLEKQNQKDDTKLNIEAQLQSYYFEMLSAYNIYNIIQNEALPQVAHMFDLSSSAIATGADLFKYIDVLFDKLSLEKKGIDAIATYYKAQAHIDQLQGKLQ